MQVIAAILAAGSGVRLGSDTPKQLLKIAGKTVLEHTLDVFDAVEEIDEIMVVTRSDLITTVREIVANADVTKVNRVLAGGETRNDSTMAAMDAVADLPEGKILLHDAVRPFVDARIIQECINALDEVDAVDVAIPSADTIIEVDHVRIQAIPERGRLRRGQTPQAFKLSTLREAYQLAADDPSFVATDDCGVVAQYLPDTDIRVVEGSETNIKITHPIDVYLADKLFQVRTLDSQVSQDDESVSERLDGKHIVIFGGSYGIGAEIGELAGELGAVPHLLSRSMTGTHVEDSDDVRVGLAKVHAETGAIHHVVNTAGLLRIKAIAQQNDAEIEELVKVNYLGAVNVARSSHRYLKETRGQLLCFTSSSFTRGRALYSIYSSSKAAVVNLVQALSEEWSNDGIRVNCINPERTATPMRTANFGNEDPDSLLSARKVAEASLRALASPATGQVIDVRR